MQSGFRPGDLITNHLIDYVNEIQRSLDNKNSLEVRSVFLGFNQDVWQSMARWLNCQIDWWELAKLVL